MQPDSTADSRSIRLEKLQQLRDQGTSPYPRFPEHLHDPRASDQADTPLTEATPISLQAA